MKVLVAGIGNIFFGDDGFGVEVAARLAERSWPPGTTVADYGIRGVHLAYELLDGYDVLILVDAVPMGERPGTLAVIDVDVHDLAPSAAPLDAHTMTPAVVLGTLDRLGGTIDRVLVIGCEPAVITARTGLSPSVAAAIPMAVDLVAEVLDDVLAPAGKEPR